MKQGLTPREKIRIILTLYDLNGMARNFKNKNLRYLNEQINRSVIKLEIFKISLKVSKQAKINKKENLNNKINKVSKIAAMTLHLTITNYIL
jgi:hypothetical protein